VFDNKMWLIGGYNGLGTADIWSSVDGKNWEKEHDNAPFGERFGFDVTEFNGELWLTGGHVTSPYVEKQDIWKSSDGKNWQEVLSEALWEVRHGHETLVYDDKLWLIGGFDEYADDSLKPNFLEVWNTEDGITWQLITDQAEFQTVFDDSVVVFNDQLTLVQSLIFSDEKGYFGQNNIWNSKDGKHWSLNSTNLDQC
jgi:hypothetical protein